MNALASTPDPAVPAQLLALSHGLGREDRALAILGEGNTSARTGDDTFLVKASGSSLATLNDAGLTACRLAPLLDLIGGPAKTDEEIERALFDARLDPQARKPSVEAMFHAWLLTLPGIHFVGHTHPITVNALLCSPHARTFATRRIFPDEIVCCGPESVLVPYGDPGLTLAQTIRDQVEAYRRRTGLVPRMILLESHGLIALGASPNAVLATTLMAEKAARITLGALSAGGVNYLTPEVVQRIAGRTDEHYRQKALGL